MTINTEVLCESCKECRLFSIKEEELWGADELYGKIYYCKNIEICKKAVEIWEKQNENHSNDD